MLRTPRRPTIRNVLVSGAIALLPALLASPTETRAQTGGTWETTWDAAWAHATKYYAIQTATTLTSDPSCQGDLGFKNHIRDLTRAVQAKKQGDALRLLGVIQDKSMCLTLEGTRGLEYAIAGWIHRSAMQLPPAQAEIAEHGALNVGALVFDQLQYTRRSWLLPTLYHHANTIGPMVARYPKDLGFYAFDWSRGTLVGGIDPVGFANSMRNLTSYGDGSCTLLDMSSQQFFCKGWVGAGGLGGGGGGGGKNGAVGGLPSTPRTSGAVSCIVAAAGSTGGRGQLACASKAVAGMTFNPRTTTPASLLQSGLAGGQAVKDPRCALSEDAGNGGKQQDTEAKKKEPSTWDKLADGAKAAANYVKDVVMTKFDKTPVGVAELSQLASPEGADAVRGGLQAAGEIKARESLLNDDGVEDYYKQREGRVVKDPQANNQRTIDRPGIVGGGGGGSCGRGSNAARRANALYDCISGGVKPPQNRGPNSPVIALTDPAQVQPPPPTGALACMQQAGDMVRNGVSDPKCAMARCAQGALSCPCDKPGGPGGSGITQGGFTPRVSATTSPNCATPPCGTTLGGGGTGTVRNPTGGPPDPGGPVGPRGGIGPTPGTPVGPGPRPR